MLVERFCILDPKQFFPLPNYEVHIFQMFGGYKKDANVKVLFCFCSLSITYLLVNILSLLFTNTIRVNVVLIKMTKIMLKARDDAAGDGGSVLARLMLLVRRFQFKAFSISNSRE